MGNDFNERWNEHKRAKRKRVAALIKADDKTGLTAYAPRFASPPSTPHDDMQALAGILNICRSMDGGHHFSRDIEVNFGEKPKAATDTGDSKESEQERLGNSGEALYRKAETYRKLFAKIGGEVTHDNPPVLLNMKGVTLTPLSEEEPFLYTLSFEQKPFMQLCAICNCNIRSSLPKDSQTEWDALNKAQADKRAAASPPLR